MQVCGIILPDCGDRSFIWELSILQTEFKQCQTDLTRVIDNFSLTTCSPDPHHPWYEQNQNTDDHHTNTHPSEPFPFLWGHPHSFQGGRRINIGRWLRVHLDEPNLPTRHRLAIPRSGLGARGWQGLILLQVADPDFYAAIFFLADLGVVGCHRHFRTHR